MDFTLNKLFEILQQQQLSTTTTNLPDSPSHVSTQTNAISSSIGEPSQAKPSNRCSHNECKKKLLLSDIQCKCNERFCITHRMPESHNCSFDYKAVWQSQLTTALPKVIGSKLEKI